MTIKFITFEAVPVNSCFSDEHGYGGLWKKSDKHSAICIQTDAMYVEEELFGFEPDDLVVLIGE